VANIYEVAKRAGVSTATVSRVLSQPAVVSPDTRRKVMQAVELLDYAPNRQAPGHGPGHLESVFFPHSPGD
jgi:DNA-binding LacI/PurR family transcriptional regulator